MIIKNYNKNITCSQINELIKILPNKYKNLDIEIIYPKNKWQCLKWLYLREFKYNIKEIFRGTLGGSSCILHNKIFIYYFNYNTQNEYGQIEKLRAAETLYHEIRHQWQKINNKLIFNKCNGNDDYKNKIAYTKQKHEIDANIFAKYIMNKNFDDILNVIK